MDFDFGRFRSGERRADSPPEEAWKILARLGGPILRPLNDPFFGEGDAVCEMRDPQIFEEFDVEEFLHKDYKPFPCSEQGCDQVFAQLIDSEAHYNTSHRFPCSECSRGFITSHLLELHVLENHDAFFKVSSSKKPSYACFLEVCKEKFWTPRDRTHHGIEDHGFDPDMDFLRDQELKSEASPLRKKKARRPLSMALSSRSKDKASPHALSPAKSTNNLSPIKSTPVNLRPSKIPVRSFSYKNISFGSGITKTFDTSQLNQRWFDSRFESATKKKKRNSLEIHNMEDIKKSLPSIK
uniref:Zinc finger protein 511 n=1 Tax=Caligus clemensi TaxID=344056 RepID=C1C398_CALCM|nr:Zinc finger protein 511 [Caligus clemensi]